VHYDDSADKGAGTAARIGAEEGAVKEKAGSDRPKKPT
jgi:hypothetical protein